MKEHHHALAALALALAGTASANDQLFDLPLESLMELRVSVASPFAESVMDSASSVSVLRPADWRQRGARSLEDALEQVPAVVPYASLGGASQFAIRGYANEISVRGLAMQLDGVPLNNFSFATGAYNLPQVPLSLLERVEMIRGTGSTLYGSDAFHGVLALNTWAPATQQRAAEVRLGYPRQGQVSLLQAGTSGSWQASGGITATDNGDRNQAYAYIAPLTNQPGRSEWDNNERDLSGFLRLERGDAAQGLWRASLYADHYDSSEFPSVGSQFFLPLTSPARPSPDYLADRDHMGQRSTFLLGQLQHERELGDRLRLHLRTFAWRSDLLWEFDSTGYPDNAALAAAGIPLACMNLPTDPPPRWPLTCPHRQYQGTDEGRLGVHALLLGDSIARTQWALGAGRDRFDIFAAPLRRIGIAGQTHYDTPAPFEGLRRDVDHVLLQARTDLSPWTLAWGARWDDYSDVGDAVSPRFAAIYQPANAGWTGKFLYGHAFRAPAAVERYGSGGSTQQLPNPGLKPETIDTFELVWQLRRNDHDSEVVLFTSRWQDGVVLASVAGGASQYQNTGRNSSHGIEFTHHHRLGAWRLAGNLSWVFSENDRGGVEYAGFPAWTGNFTASRHIAGRWEIALTQRLMLDMAQGDATGNRIPPRAPDYYRSDVHAGWRDGALSLGMDLRNVFDRDNIVPSMVGARGGTTDAGVDVVFSAEYAL